MLDMGTKQHTTFCPSCGKKTNHVTRYHKDAGGGPLIASVRCAEHTDAAF
jgi:ribosomal protein L44E